MITNVRPMVAGSTSAIVSFPNPAANRVLSTNPTTVYSSNNSGAYLQSGNEARQYYKFSTSISSGLLAIGLNLGAGSPGIGDSLDFDARVYLSEADWDTSTLTWNNQPSLPATYYEFNVNPDMTLDAMFPTGFGQGYISFMAEVSAPTTGLVLRVLNGGANGVNVNAVSDPTLIALIAGVTLSQLLVA